MAAFWTNALDFPNLTVKGSPIGADSILIADSTTSPAGQPKQALISSLPFTPIGGAAFVDVNAATQAMVIDTIYFVRYAGGVCTLTLPTAASSPFGAFIGIFGVGAISNPWVVAQAASQFIQFIDQVTTTGVSGTLTAGNKFNSIILRNMDQGGTGLTWGVQSSEGSFSGA